MDDVPSLAEYAQQCRDWLATQAGRRPPKAELTWGQGDDAVELFEETDPAAEVDEIAAVRAWRSRLWDAGYAWITGPVELGGAGLTRAHQQAFDSAAREYAVPSNVKLMVSLGMVAPTILTHGTEGAKARYCAALQRGDLIACQLFSEPGAGSALAGVSTQAVRDGDGWRITGQKVWTSGAQVSDIGEVLCRTRGEPRHRNLTMFVVDMRAPGVEVRPLRQMTGGAAFNEVFLDDVWVPDDDRLGEVDDGWRVAVTTLSHERATVGGEGYGGAGLLRPERYLQMLAVLGRQDDPLARQAVARLVTELRVAKLNGQRAAAARQAGRAPGPEASLGKIGLTRNYQRISALVGDLLGPRLLADTGEWGTFAWTSFVLGTPGVRIGGGTDEVLMNVLAERALGLPKG